MTSEWSLYVRDSNYLRVAEIDDYESVRLVPVFNDVGSWSLTIDARARSVGLLLNPGYGIIACRNDVPVFSGPWSSVRHRREMDSWNIDIQGLTDEVCLVDRLVSPSPAEAAPPYSAQASDIRSGVASTVVRAYVDVNVGPSAVPARRTPGLTMATDPVVGGTVRGEARWDSDVLAFIQPLATSGNVGFRVRQIGVGIVFEVFAPGDKSAAVKYSIDLGNLESYEYSRTRPKSDFVYVGASGTGTTRIVREFTDGAAYARWGRVEGQLVNESSSTDTTIAQAGADALAQGSEQISLSITPIEIPGMQFGVDYGVGDKISVQLEAPSLTPYSNDGLIADIVRQVEVNLVKDGPQTVTPTLGTPTAGDVSKLVDAFQRANVRINKLERS